MGRAMVMTVLTTNGGWAGDRAALIVRRRRRIDGVEHSSLLQLDRSIHVSTVISSRGKNVPLLDHAARRPMVLCASS